MRKFGRLPPLLRGTSLLGLLVVLAAGAMFLKVLFTILLSTGLHQSADNAHMGIIALNLITVGVACDFPARLYLLRWHRPDRQLFPLDSWQSQVRLCLLVTVLPLGTLALVVVIPPATFAFAGVISFSVLEALVLFGASLRMNHGAASSELQRPL